MSTTPGTKYLESKIDFSDLSRLIRLHGTSLYECSVTYKNGLIPKCELVEDKNKTKNINGIFFILQDPTDENTVVKVKIISVSNGIDINVKRIKEPTNEEVENEDFTVQNEDEIIIKKNGKRITQFYELWEACDNRHFQWEKIEGKNTVPEYFKKGRHALAEGIQSVEKYYRSIRKLPSNQVTITIGDNKPREYQTLLYAFGVMRTNVDGKNKDELVRPNAKMISAKGVKTSGGKRKSSRKKKTRRNKKTKKSRKSRRKSNRRS